MMPYDVIEARHVGGFVLWLRFRDGIVGEIDLTAELHRSCLRAALGSRDVPCISSASRISHGDMAQWG